MSANEPDSGPAPGLFMRIMQRMMPMITTAHVGMYRALKGRIVNRGFGGAPLLLLTTTGRTTGQPRTVALGHLEDGDHFVVAGTNGGLEPRPSWIMNLDANPSCTVELGDQRFDAEAEFLTGKENEDHWARFVDRFPVYEEARRWAGRAVPLVRLRRSDNGPLMD